MMPPDPPRPESASEILTRQGFLAKSMRHLMEQVAQRLPDFEQTAPEEAPQLRPPGALSGSAFFSTCEPFCQKCITACPRQSILHDAFGFPYLQPEQSPCVMCTDVPCTRVCPTGALTPLATPREIAMGTAIIELTVCTAFQGSGCRTCYDSCPLPGEALQLIEGLPQVVPEQCTGCGVCVHECPTPGAMHIQPHPNPA